MPTTTDFYITGGTLPTNASSYVTRQADTDLYDNLLRGQFCYVLNTRQMGKSSLMVRTAERLRAEGIQVVTLDLTAIGQNVTPEQWYDGLLTLIAERLDLEEELEQFWREHKKLGPMQRFLTALQQAILPHVERLVLFVDEIDAVRSLPFSTDEFFAGIRESYNRRTVDPEFHRLTFCLLGVATPSDLISDTRISPFNIGKRIPLADFTEAEALPLAAGLKQGVGGRSWRVGWLLKRVLYWTGGHPYMTQRLCRAIEEALSAPTPYSLLSTPSLVDVLCERLFLKKGACDTDDNLAFVRNRLLRTEMDLAALLDFYKQVGTGRRVKDDETNPLCAALRLSGVCRAEKGLLKVRNRIYARVFDRKWILNHMPYAELRRQRAAYRAGVLRTAGIGSAILAVMGALAVTALVQARRADFESRMGIVATNLAWQRQSEAQEARRTAEQLLYVSNVAMAAQVWESDDGAASTVQMLLDTCRFEAGRPDLRGFEWLYQQSILNHTSAALFRGAPGEGVQAVFLPERDVILLDGNAQLHRFRILPDKPLPGAPAIAIECPIGGPLNTGQEVGPPLALQNRYPLFASAHLSTDGRTVTVELKDGSIRILDLCSGTEQYLLKGPALPVPEKAIAISPQETLLAVGDDNGIIRFRTTGQQRRKASEVEPYALTPIHAHNGEMRCLAWSRDGKLLASGARDGLVRVWDTATHRRLFNLKGHLDAITSLQFRADGKQLLSGSTDGTARLWDLTQTSAVWVQEHEPERLISHIAFSPYSNGFACTNSDFLTVRNARTGKEALRVGGEDIRGMSYAPDGKTLVYADTLRSHASPLRTSRIHCLDTVTGQERWLSPGPTAQEEYRRILCDSLCFSPDGRWIACGYGSATARQAPYENCVRILDAATGRLLHTLRGFSNTTTALFSPDGYLLAVACYDKTVHIYETRSWSEAVVPLTLARPGLALAFAPHTRRLAIGGEDGLLIVQECLSRGNYRVFWGETHPLKGHTGTIGGLAFSPEGTTLASASWDRTVRLWNVASHREMRQLSGAATGVHAITFVPGGTWGTLAAGDGDGHVRFWEVDRPSPAESAAREESARADRERARLFQHAIH